MTLQGHLSEAHRADHQSRTMSSIRPVCSSLFPVEWASLRVLAMSLFHAWERGTNVIGQGASCRCSEPIRCNFVFALVFNRNIG
jgi:hypothetical protein